MSSMYHPNVDIKVRMTWKGWNRAPQGEESTTNSKILVAIA